MEKNDTKNVRLKCQNSQYKYRVLDLFCGAGGFSCGIDKNVDFETAVSIDFDKNASTTFQNNFPNATCICGDICNSDIKEKIINESKNSNVSIIVGGPPCQGFSMAGARIRAGFIDDPRNYLFKHYFNIVKELKPKVFIFENVKGLTTMQGGKIFSEILNIFSDESLLGKNSAYNLFSQIVKATDFGIPQKRERLIIIGIQGQKQNHENFISDCKELWESTKKQISTENKNFFDKVSIYDAISNLPIETEDGNINNPVSTNEYQKYLESKSEIIKNHNKTHHSKKAVERMSKVKSGENFTVLDEEINSIHSGSYGRLSWNGVSPTITTRFDTPAGGCFTHPEKNRTLTPREAARIQSFPDDFTFYGNRTAVCKQIGNAVPPKISYFLSRFIQNILEK